MSSTGCTTKTNYYCNVHKVRVFHQKNLIEIFMIATWRRNGRALMLDRWWEQILNRWISQAVSITVVCCPSIFVGLAIRNDLLSYLHPVRMKWDSLDVAQNDKIGTDVWSNNSSNLENMRWARWAASPQGFRCQPRLEARGCEHDANTLLDPPTWGSNNDMYWPLRIPRHLVDDCNVFLLINYLNRVLRTVYTGYHMMGKCFLSADNKNKS